jgi:two-component system, chemotaxis family, sensor kinase CheA
MREPVGSLPPSGERASSNPTVLLVDDYQLGRELASRILRRAGFAVRDASSAEEALERARRDPPAVIVSDVHLTGMSGLDLCHAVRADPALARIPILLLSSAMSESEQDQARALGARCLQRTSDLAGLLEALRSTLGRAGGD